MAEKYLLPGNFVDCKASGLYGARCGILHSLERRIQLIQATKVRQVLYAWGTTKTDHLASASQRLSRNDCVIHLRKFIDAFRKGLANYIDEVVKDEQRSGKIEASLKLWFVHMPEGAIQDFLRNREPPGSS